MTCESWCVWPLFLLLVAPAVTESPSNVSPSGIEQAHDSIRTGQHFQREKRYDLAAECYEQATKLARVVLAAQPGNPLAQKQLNTALAGWSACLSAPLQEELGRLRAQAEETAVETSAAFLALGDKYAEAVRKCDQGALRTNRDFCYDKAGSFPIRRADHLREAGQFVAAAELYELAVQRYEEVHERLGEVRFQNNLNYARYFLPLCRFQQAVADRAPAPDFALEDGRGGKLTLSSTRGQVVLLFVWGSWCRHCERLWPLLQDCQEKYGSQGFTTVALCVDRVPGWSKGDEKRAGERLRTAPVPAAWADEQLLEKLGSPETVPSFIWIDRAGNLVGSGLPGNDRAQALPRKIEELLGTTESVTGSAVK